MADLVAWRAALGRMGFNNTAVTVITDANRENVELDNLQDDMIEIQNMVAKADEYYPQHFSWGFWVLFSVCCFSWFSNF